MIGRSITGFNTISNLRSNYIELRNSKSIFSIYGTNNNVPIFSANGETGITIDADLNVAGTATFQNFDIQELSGGMLGLASTNVTDTIDIGLYGQYDAGAGLRWAGLFRDASDTLKRWTLIDNLTTEPTTTVANVNTNLFSSLRMSQIYLNNGTALLPALTFNSEQNTGFYLSATNTISVSLNGAENIRCSTTETKINTPLLFKKKIQTNNNTNIILTDEEHVLLISATVPVVITLPPAAAHSGKEYVLIKTAATGIVTIQTTNPNTIDDGISTSDILDIQYDRITFLSDGDNQWYSL